MKVLLLKDIKKIGRKHEVKNVPDGYANNYLIPQGMALRADSKRAAQLMNLVAGKQSQTEKQAAGLADKLRTLDTSIIIQAQANEKGSLYAAITKKDLAHHISETIAMKVSESHITCEPIKELGDHTAQVTAGEERIPVVISVQSS